jgi:hypothetical protein
MIIKLSSEDCRRLSSWWMAQLVPALILLYLAYAIFATGDRILGYKLIVGAALCLLFVLSFFGIVTFFRLRRGLLDDRDTYEALFPRFTGLRWMVPIITLFGILTACLFANWMFEPWKWFIFLFTSFTVGFYDATFVGSLQPEVDLPSRRLRVGGTPLIASEETRQLTLAWRFSGVTGETSAGKEMAVSIRVGVNRSTEARNRNIELFQRTNPWSVPAVKEWPALYVVGGGCPEIGYLSSELNLLCERYGLCELQQVELFLAAVQSIPFQSDQDSVGTPEYPRYPIETLYEKVADDEDCAILLAALLRESGYETALLDCGTHLACGVRLSHPFTDFEPLKGYVYCETTPTGYRVGAKPDNVVVREILPVPPLEPPIIVRAGAITLQPMQG